MLKMETSQSTENGSFTLYRMEAESEKVPNLNPK
jgi:hypothetical protein